MDKNGTFFLFLPFIQTKKAFFSPPKHLFKSTVKNFKLVKLAKLLCCNVDQKNKAFFEVIMITLSKHFCFLEMLRVSLYPSSQYRC